MAGTPNTQTVVTADLTSLAFISEGAAYGVEPSTPTYKIMRFTRHGMKENSEFERSKEMRGDRQTIDSKRVGLTAGGTIDVEMSAGSHDEFMCAAIGSTDNAFASDPSSNSGIEGTVVAATQVFSGTNIALNVDVGMFVKISGFTNTLNNRTYRVTANPDDDTMTVSPAPAADEAAVPSIICQPFGFQENFTNAWSFSIEENRSDAAATADQYSLGLGMMISQWSFDAKVKSIMTMSFDMTGKTYRPITNTSSAGYTAADTSTVMGAVDEITGFVFGLDSVGDSVDLPIESFTFSISNNLRERLILGGLGPDSLGQGKFECSGSFNAYFSDKTVLSNFSDSDDHLHIAFHILDGTGEEYIFDFPRVKITDASSANDGENNDIMVPVTFDALMDLDVLKTMRIHRLGVA